MSMVEGLVSTVIPVYNRPEMLRQAVASVLTQTWRSLEIIIVDDGSTDDTPTVAVELSVRHPKIIRVVHQQNAGPGAARQAGFEASNGEFVQFLDSDCLLLPKKFELQVSGLRGDTKAGISYGKTYVRENGQRFPNQPSAEKHREIFPVLLTRRLWDTSAPLYRHIALQKIGPWPPGRWLEDWEFDGKAGAARIKLHYCDEYISETINHSGPKLNQLWKSNPDAVRDGISAHITMVGHAQRAGIARDSPEMQRFTGDLFWAARLAGRYGMSREAQYLFDLALMLCLKPRWDYRVFGVATSVLGWDTASHIARFAKNIIANLTTSRNVAQR
jgi:glycosyltransferase involved in cell wall biosynthesis